MVLEVFRRDTVRMTVSKSCWKRYLIFDDFLSFTVSHTVCTPISGLLIKPAKCVARGEITPWSCSWCIFMQGAATGSRLAMMSRDDCISNIYRPNIHDYWSVYFLLHIAACTWLVPAMTPIDAETTHKTPNYASLDPCPSWQASIGPDPAAATAGRKSKLATSCWFRI